MRKLEKLLKDRNITEDEAIKYIESSIPYKRTWKMWRFTLYLWKKVERHKRPALHSLTRIETVAEVVRSGKYRRLYETFPLLKFDAKKEIKNLTQLIAEPRQDKSFKEGNFKYEHRDKIIPQGHINELR